MSSSSSVTEPGSISERQDIVFESFGVGMRVSADTPEVIERLPSLLPPDSAACAPSEVQESFGIVRDVDGSYQFTRGDSPVSTGVDLELALMLLETQVRIFIGLNAANRIFVHAGVVGYGGRAIVIPGRSFTGKTTLVTALVRAGAAYYSDEFAVIDERGMVHPFAKPLSVRDGGARQSDHAVSRFGGVEGEEPLKIGAVVFTKYRPGGHWAPQSLTPGRGVLAMFENTLAAMERSEEAMRAIKAAIAGAVLLEGERGEADDLVAGLLEAVAGPEA
jgi:hypothetical protein